VRTTKIIHAQSNRCESNNRAEEAVVDTLVDTLQDATARDDKRHVASEYDARGIAVSKRLS
jgi:hypothetical protein